MSITIEISEEVEKRSSGCNEVPTMSERTADHWFPALREITGINPVSESSRGNLKEMAHA